MLQKGECTVPRKGKARRCAHGHALSTVPPAPLFWDAHLLGGVDADMMLTCKLQPLLHFPTIAMPSLGTIYIGRLIVGIGVGFLSAVV